MSRLDIRLDEVRAIVQQWERTVNRLSQTTQQLAALRSRVDGAIQARRDIGRRLQAAYHQAADAEQRLRQLRAFLLQAAGTYSDAEDELARRADGLTRSSGTVTKRAGGLPNRVDWSGLWDSLSPRLLAYMDAVKQERYNIEGIDWSQVPANLIDSLKASIDASARQQAEASARADTLDDVRHVGGYTMEGPERTRYYTDRHGKQLLVDSERMVGLIDSYNRMHGTNVHTPDVALLMSVDVTGFLRYALEQGYDPRTFQPVNDGDAREIEGYITARQQHGEEHLRGTRAWQSEALGWIPGISGAKEAADVIAGKDILTGEPLTKLDYGMAALSALGPLGKGAKKIVKFSADKFAGKADEVMERMGEVVPEINPKYATAIDNKVTLKEQVELPTWLKETYTDGQYRTVITNENITVHRTFGGKAGEGGAFATTVPAANRITSKIDSALLPEWKNSRQYEAVIEIPKGIELNIGKVEQQMTQTGTVLRGGGDQILLPQNWPKEWIKEIREVPSR